ncbi:MAG: hypothetical protein ABI779_23035 [Acidobacteriota bacterium]
MSEARRTFAAGLLVVLVATALYAIHPSFFVRDDFQLQYLPGSREVARAWSSGEIPLLTRSSWVCTALGAEYQFGVFSLFRALLDLLVWALPLSLSGRGAMLFIVHAAIAAAGGYRLARSYGARSGAAMMVALVAGLNGWTLWWATTWLTAVASFAWLPWYWLALRGIGHGRSRWSWAGAAFAFYLLVAAGWPYSVVMALAVAAMQFFSALGKRQWRAAFIMCGASLLGLGLAAPAVLMLLEYFPYTARTNAATAFESIWFLPPGALFGLVLPSFSVVWPVFAGAWPHPAVELVGAFVPLAAVLAASGRRFAAKFAPELLLLLGVLVLVLLPAAGPFRWSFRWLPLFHLTLALLGAVAIGEARRRVTTCAFALLAVTMVASWAWDQEWRASLASAATLATLCAVWAVAEKRAGRIAEALPAVITGGMIVMTFLTFAGQAGEVPAWSEDESLLAPAPFDPARRYLALYEIGAVVETSPDHRNVRGVNVALRPGNIPMYAGLDFINGYSPLGLAALKNVFHFDAHGPLESGEEARRILRDETGPLQLLEQLGVNGLVAREGMAREYAPLLAARGWRPVARIAECIVLHRGEAAAEPLFAPALAVKTGDAREAYAAIFGRKTATLPVVLYTPGPKRIERYGPRNIDRIEVSRNGTAFVVRGTGPKALIVFRRPWIPGLQATVGGEPVPVLRASMILPAIEIPPNAEGQVRLAYRPRSLVVGTWLAIAALAVIAGVALRVRR